MVEIEANGFGVLRAIASGNFSLHFNLTAELLFSVTTGLIHWLALCLLCETNIMGRWTQYDEVLPSF